MNNKVIKSRKNLPEWFVTREYREISDPISWAVEIKTRINIREAFTRQDKDVMDGKKPSYYFLKILDNVGINCNKCYSKNGEVIALPVIFGSLDIRQPVSDMTMRDAIHLAAILPDETKKPIKSIKNLVQAKKKDIKRKDGFLESTGFCKQRDSVLDEISRLPISEHTLNALTDSIINPYVSLSSFISGDLCTVDLSLDDETLKESFMKWVHTTRNNCGLKILDKKLPLTKETLTEWNKYKPLQVFDIDLWSKLTSTRITDPVLANFLWPSGDENSEDINPVSRLRQVTRKSKVPDIISQHMLWRLKGLIGSKVRRK